MIASKPADPRARPSGEPTSVVAMFGPEVGPAVPPVVEVRAAPLW
jgi:hypothetical protein